LTRNETEREKKTGGTKGRVEYIKARRSLHKHNFVYRKSRKEIQGIEHRFLWM